MLDPPRRLAAALAGAGVILCVLGWYQISGQPTVPQQLPYLASATIPGAVLLAVGLVLALRGPLPPGLERLLGAREPSGERTPGRPGPRKARPRRPTGPCGRCRTGVTCTRPTARCWTDART